MHCNSSNIETTPEVSVAVFALNNCSSVKNRMIFVWKSVLMKTQDHTTWENKENRVNHQPELKTSKSSKLREHHVGLSHDISCSF